MSAQIVSIMSTIKLYNERPLSCTSIGSYELQFPQHNYKYADVEWVYARSNNLVRQIIDAAPISKRYKRVLVDVKVQQLVPDRCSCIPGWHLDGSQRELELFHICVLNGPRTQFIAHPILLSSDYETALSQIPSTVKVTEAGESAITSYTSNHFHRGVYTEQPTVRLLVRLCETNTILPRNKIFTPAGALV